MDNTSETDPFCNSTSKNHLQLQLEQPTNYTDDIKNLEERSDNEEEAEMDEEAKQAEIEETKTETSSSKIPLIYQVEPGCTALGCYSAILTFIVMTMGVFWLLLISPPRTSIPVTIPPGERVAYLYDYEENDDSDYVAFTSAESPSIISTIIPALTEAAISSQEPVLVTTTAAPPPVTVGPEIVLDKLIKDDSTTT